MFQAFLIKYAEIAVKGKNRYLFEDALVHQIVRALREVDGEFKVYKTQGRIHVDALSDFDYDETIAVLTRVFGITAICPVVVLEDEGFEKLCEEVVSYVDKVYADKDISFKVNSRRARKNYPLESMEINAKVGEAVLNAYASMHVDVHQPEVMINIEIRERIYLYSISVKGAGGMPIGTGGKATLLHFRAFANDKDSR